MLCNVYSPHFVENDSIIFFKNVAHTRNSDAFTKNLWLIFSFEKFISSSGNRNLPYFQVGYTTKYFPWLYKYHKILKKEKKTNWIQYRPRPSVRARTISIRYGAARAASIFTFSKCNPVQKYRYVPTKVPNFI